MISMTEGVRSHSSPGSPSEIGGVGGNKLVLPQHAALGKPHTGSPQSNVSTAQFKVCRADPNFGPIGEAQKMCVFWGWPHSNPHPT